MLWLIFNQRIMESLLLIVVPIRVQWEFLRTLYMPRHRLDICDKEVTITWNAYQNWNTGVLRYEVYASSGGAYSLISSLGSSVTSYVHTGVLANTLYCYVIRAVNVGETSSSISNKVCRFVNQPPLPQFAYLQTATVVSDDEIEVRFHPDVSAIVNSYTLERTDNLANPFDVVSVSTGGGIQLYLLIMM